MPDFTFDLNLFASLTFEAADERHARAIMRDALDCADMRDALDCAELDGSPDLIEINGELIQ